MTPWEIKAREFANCNCDYGCPCQFNGLPTTGQCQAVFAIEIDEGHYGDVKLDGLRMAGVFWWPGAVHEGRGKAQPIVDVRANEAQRNALLALMSGQDSDPFATMFNVYASMLEEVFEPIVTEIDFKVDVDGRTAHIIVDGVIDSKGEPIRNKVTGEPSRGSIYLPNGFEYTYAEMGSGTSRTKGNIELTMDDSYGQFALIHLNNHGIVRPSDYATQ